MNNYEKLKFVLSNKFRYLPIEEIIRKCLAGNYTVSYLARKELIRRQPIDLPVEDNVVTLIVKKMTIEEIFEILAVDVDTPLSRIAYIELKKIFTYYEQNNPDYYRKLREDETDNNYLDSRNNLKLVK